MAAAIEQQPDLAVLPPHQDEDVPPDATLDVVTPAGNLALVPHEDPSASEDTLQFAAVHPFIVHRLDRQEAVSHRLEDLVDHVVNACRGAVV
jgi:hypothetical protein